MKGSHIMPNTLATITVKQIDAPKLLSVFSDLNVECNHYREYSSIIQHGIFLASYTVDVTSECLDHIKNQIDIVSLTATHYTTTQPFGLRVINTH